jgi:hypothetical protein
MTAFGRKILKLILTGLRKKHAAQNMWNLGTNSAFALKYREKRWQTLITEDLTFV